ncbi:hypothetical protein ACTJKN_05150 [Pedobacter sp. 22163]|uniref:hypothetical protein n=1 Tax=Pedobacter sp. 22163 TaxID=3453883 RepID=UPI003F864B0C
MRSLLTLIKIIALVMIIQACSKRVVDLEKSSAAFNLRLTTDSSSRVQLKTVFYQTSKSFRFTTDEYEFEIIPDGEFTFGPEQGFKGKAKSVKGKGKKTVQEDNQVDTSLKKDSTASVKSGKILDQSSKSSGYSKSSAKIPAKIPSIGLIILMVVSLAAIPAFIFLKPYIVKLWKRLF